MGIPCGSLRCCRLDLHRQQEEQPSGESETPVFLPNDLIFNILSRVPVKALCRLRCVSREWCALISGPDFAAAHRCAEQLLVVTSCPDLSLRLIDMDGCLVRVIKNIGKYWTPVCTGPSDALCVMGYLGDMGSAAGVIDLSSMKLVATYLGTTGHKPWGLGHAVPSGVCKVVRFTSTHQSEVFTIGDNGAGGWRKAHTSGSRTGNVVYYSFSLDTVVANGVLHFVTATGPDGHISVLRFDLEREEWKETIKGPPNVNMRPSIMIRLAELNGAFSLVQPDSIRPEDIPGYINIWLLLGPDNNNNNSNNTWVKRYRIPFDTAKYYHMAPLRVIDDGSKLLLRLITCKGTAPVLHIYDSLAGTCTDATKNLLRGHISTDSYNISIGLCNMRLEHFVPSKIKHRSTLSQVFI